ncbi:hypothetical protein BDF19DRAFT_239695 [Syncephalis fuscata]|nr:hypothetical protein BDF19DRAFT_239695 [Syncephalis fuscata]
MPYIDNLDKASNVDLKEQSKATVTNIHNFVVRFDNRVNYNVETVEAYGDVGSVIEKHLNENYPIVDVLIAGSRNHQGLTKLILGSVSEYLIQHMDCPVTIVKQTSE